MEGYGEEAEVLPRQPRAIEVTTHLGFGGRSAWVYNQGHAPATTRRILLIIKNAHLRHNTDVLYQATLATSLRLQLSIPHYAQV